MPVVNGYATLTELKAARRITDTSVDTALEAALTRASRAIDTKTGRRFWVDSVTSPRIYRPMHEELLTVDDFSTSTGLIVETGRGTSWSVLDANSYDLLPENAEANMVAIETIQRVVGCWPLWGTTRVRVTAKWGWPAVPDEISQAALLLANRLYLRKDSPEGIAGSTEWGVIRLSRWDPDVEALVGPYVLPGFG